MLRTVGPGISFRLEASAFAHKRGATGFLASATPPSDGFFVIDPGTGLPVEVDASTFFRPFERGEGGGIRLDNPAAFSFFGKASITISFP